MSYQILIIIASSYGNPDQLPAITGATLGITQGSPAMSQQIATVSDADQAANTLTVAVTPLTGAGVTVGTPSINAAGQVTASLQASCTATNSTFTLTVADNQNATATATLTVNVTANTQPTLSYGNQSVGIGGALTVNPATGPSDNGSIASITVQSAGTYTGAISVNSSGVVSISNAAPAGTHTITIRATDNCGATKDASFTLSVVNTPAGANVTVNFGPISVTFTNVVTLGITTVTPIDPASVGKLPDRYVLKGLKLAWDIDTTATFSGPITICFNVSPVNDQTLFDKLRILHREGLIKEDRTILPPNSPAPNFATRTICARVTSLSPFVIAVLEPSPGPGALAETTSPVSDQKAGSVLIYNLYTSSSDPNRQNTRLSLTNTNPQESVSVHLFFVDGSSCSVADSYVCLTANQTASFLASDLDPGTTGYIVAVAVDAKGCPLDFNYLIGDEYVKFASGHAANLGAEAIAAIDGGLPACDENSVTATLAFDGVSFNVLPRVLAVDNVPSRADGNDTLLILNRIGGNLGTGAATLTGIFGILYDDAENALSFAFSPGACQLRSGLSNNFPRTAPRFEQFIPAGRSGWARIYSQNDQAISGAQINFNPNAGAQANAYNQGHNLHVLTNTSTATFVIPIFPPSC